MLTKRERFGLTSIFLLGAITLAVSTVRMIMSIRAVLTLDSRERPICSSLFRYVMLTTFSSRHLVRERYPDYGCRSPCTATTLRHGVFVLQEAEGGARERHPVTRWRFSDWTAASY